MDGVTLKYVDDKMKIVNKQLTEFLPRYVEEHKMQTHSECYLIPMDNQCN